jgi:TatD DNase family protein
MPFDRIIPETDGPFGSIRGEVLIPGGGGRFYDEYATMTGRNRQDVERGMTANFRELTRLSSSANRTDR